MQAKSSAGGLADSVFFTAPEDADLFGIAPVALLVVDCSALKQLFGQWRSQGVIDLCDWLEADRVRAAECFQKIQILKANQRALTLLGAADFQQFIENFGRASSADKLFTYIGELVRLWNGQTSLTAKSVNYSLPSQKLDLCLEARIMPGHEADWSRVIYAIQDISAEESARRQIARSEAYARGVFEQSPISLWVEDFRAVKTLFDAARAEGITNLPRYIKAHPEFAENCLRAIRVLDVNQQTLTLFGAPDKATLLDRVDDIFQGEVQSYFTEELIELWEGKLRQQHEVVNYTLAGDPVHLMLQLSVMPGHEHDWSLVLVALTDITARKKAEASLAYLGRYDVLTRVYNRLFYVEEIYRLQKAGPFPIGVIIADLNGLKPVNDKFGHAAGDEMLCRAGDVLTQAVGKQGFVARIGGDEFVILMPETGPDMAEKIVETIMQTTEANNQLNATLGRLSFSIGHAICDAGSRIEASIQKADLLMYKAKRDYYATSGKNRRRDTANSS